MYFTTFGNYWALGNFPTCVIFYYIPFFRFRIIIFLFKYLTSLPFIVIAAFKPSSFPDRNGCERHEFMNTYNFINDSPAQGTPGTRTPCCGHVNTVLIQGIPTKVNNTSLYKRTHMVKRKITKGRRTKTPMYGHVGQSRCFLF